MAVVDGGQECGLDRAEGCIVEILGKFAFSNVLAGDVVCLVWVVERW